jgi:hypothetical protein
VANRFVEMWRWQGTIDRKSYAVAGGSLFVLKYFLDKFVAFAVFEAQGEQAAALQSGPVKVRTPYPHYMEDYKNKGFAKWALRKWLKRKIDA